MCAIIGAFLRQPEPYHIGIVTAVLLQSGIRGLHATGISYIKDGRIQSIIEPIPASEFINDHSLVNCINENGDLYLIGHCRYSTSDLEYNQPIYNENFAIAHNGVVTQEMPEKWKELYGYDCKTRNDSELILHTLNAGKSPLEEFPDSSMAVVELHNSKMMRFYRNGKRPIYFTQIENGYIITSTADIAARAGLTGACQLPMNTYMSIDESEVVRMKTVKTNKVDLQNV